MAIIKRNNNRDELDLAALFQYILKRLWIMVIAGLLVGGIIVALLYTLVEPKYKASVRLYVNNMIDTENLENISYADISASISLTETYLTIIDSDTVFNEVEKKAGLDYSRKEMMKKVSYSAVDSTAVILIEATSTDPEEAALIANTYADVVQDKLMDIVEGSSVKILDEASVPTEHEPRGLAKKGILGFLLGAVLAALLVLIRAMNEKSIRSARDLEYFGAPILGRIPEQYKAAGKRVKKNKGKEPDSSLLLNKYTPFYVREAFNSLRTNLVYSFSGKNSKIILVTSALEHEGKTSTSINLAKALSEAGYRTLLVDGDLRRSTVSKFIKVEGTPGLSDYLAGMCEINEIVRKLADNLYAITAGTVPPNPNNLLSSAEMKKLLSAESKLYDYVIIDAPPVGPVSDPVILARMCTGYIVVVRNKVSNREDISACLKEMNVADVPMLGFVFTCESVGSGSSKRKYGYYTYK